MQTTRSRQHFTYRPQNVCPWAGPSFTSPHPFISDMFCFSKRTGSSYSWTRWIFSPKLLAFSDPPTCYFENIRNWHLVLITIVSGKLWNTRLLPVWPSSRTPGRLRLITKDKHTWPCSTSLKLSIAFGTRALWRICTSLNSLQLLICGQSFCSKRIINTHVQAFSVKYWRSPKMSTCAHSVRCSISHRTGRSANLNIDRYR